MYDSGVLTTKPKKKPYYFRLSARRFILKYCSSSVDFKCYSESHFSSRLLTFPPFVSLQDPHVRFFPMVQQTQVGQDFLVIEDLDHTQTHNHTRCDSSGRVISPTQDFYLKKHNTHKRQISMPPSGFEPRIPASKRTQTQALKLNSKIR